MNHLYYDDNLRMLARQHQECVGRPDLSVDTWHWNDSAEAAFADVMRGGNAATSTMLRAIGSRRPLIFED